METNKIPARADVPEKDKWAIQDLFATDDQCIEHLQVQMRTAIYEYVVILIFDLFNDCRQNSFRCNAAVIQRKHCSGVLHTDQPRQCTGQFVIGWDQVQIFCCLLNCLFD